MPKVSVIIPVYNAEKYIKDAIDSVLNQTYKDLEIVVVDDGSTDKTKEIVEIQRRKVVRVHVDIEYIYQMNKGPGAARNTGIKAATGEYIAFLDSDDMWMPEKIGKQVVKFKENPDYGLIHTDRIRLEPDGTLRTTKGKTLEGDVFKELLMGNFIVCSSVLIKKSCFDDIGLFDEDRNNRAEDYDIWLRIAKNYQIGFIAEPLIRYRVNFNGYNRSDIKAMYDSVENVFLKAVKFYEGDKQRLKKQRFYDMACRKASAFFYVKEYKKAFLAFYEALRVRV
jgi:glycosyltransferase involved in cell wall biosynthesis